MKTKQASLESHERKMMNFREKIEKSEPPKFQKNQQDVDFRVKAAGRRFELDPDFRRANPIFPKENLIGLLIFEVCLQSDRVCL
ncbi:MAG: hypothetical protein Q4A78_08420 [Peptostreptococcaceae bacterium]|nr:hypothetical protein [Peptostreptococcaceae bacterium]